MIGPLLAAGLDSAIYGFAVDTGMHVLPLGPVPCRRLASARRSRGRPP